VFWEPQGVGSSDKGLGLGLGLGSIFIRSKVRISLGVNNFLWPARQRSQSINRFMWRECFAWVRGLPDRPVYMKWPCLGEVHRHKNK
jgi:hypothetical protein